MLSNYKLVPVLVAILLDIEYQSKFCKILKKNLCYFCVRSCSIIQQAASGGAAQMLRIVNLFFFTYSNILIYIAQNITVLTRTLKCQSNTFPTATSPHPAHGSQKVYICPQNNTVNEFYYYNYSPTTFYTVSNAMQTGQRDV